MKVFNVLKNVLSLTFVLTTFSCSAQPTTKGYTEKEKSLMNIFQDFEKYIVSAIENKKDITDSSQIKFLLRNYLFIDSKSAASSKDFREVEINITQLASLKKQVGHFYQFIAERKQSGITSSLNVQPIRFQRDTFIYNKLTKFQKENTLVFFDDRFPDVVIGYLLFVPPMNDLIKAPRIWSWTLMYGYGKFYFKSVTGEEGYELIL